MSKQCKKCKQCEEKRKALEANAASKGKILLVFPKRYIEKIVDKDKLKARNHKCKAKNISANALATIEELKEKAIALEKKVLVSSNLKRDENFLALETALIRLAIMLDCVQTGGDRSVEKQKREVKQYICKVLDGLDNKLDENQDKELEFQLKQMGCKLAEESEPGMSEGPCSSKKKVEKKSPCEIPPSKKDVEEKPPSKKDVEEEPPNKKYVQEEPPSKEEVEEVKQEIEPSKPDTPTETPITKNVSPVSTKKVDEVPADESAEIEVKQEMLEDTSNEKI